MKKIKISTLASSFLLGLAFFSASLVSAQDAVTRTEWQMNKGKGAILLDTAGLSNDDEALYSEAEIPALGDPGWTLTPNPETIGFGGPGDSILDDEGYACRTAVDYTYFQTVVTVPSGGSVDTFRITFTGAMDDGSRISVNGKVVPGSYVAAGGAATDNLKDYFKEGENRVVITQVDNCPVGNTLASAAVELNGQVVEASNPTLVNEGQVIALRSVNVPARYVRIEDNLGELVEISSPDDAALFKVVPGLAGGNSVSFQSVNDQNLYLRHSGYRVQLANPDGSSLFEEDASFNPIDGLAGEGVSFESVNFPGYYLRHCQFQMYIDNNQQIDAKICNRTQPFFQGDSSFTVEPQ